MTISESIKIAGEGEIVRDRGERGSVPGLYVRVRGGKKVFYLYYRSKQGIQRYPKIGEYGAITLAQAREVAREWVDKVIRGEDPQAEWSSSRGELTVEDLFERTWKDYWNKARFRKSGWGKEVRNIWKRSIAKDFASKKLSQVTVADVRKWHAKLHLTPYSGNRALEVLTKMFNHAESEGIIPRNTTPCYRIKGFTEKKRRRYATPAETGKILEILEREKTNNPSAVAFLYCILFSGSRPSALERAKYEDLKVTEIDGERVGVLDFHGKGTSESGEDETIFIPSVALEMIKGLPRSIDGLLFGRKNPRRFWLRVREEAGCEDLWARDLRRTFATVGFSGGITKDVIGKLLNHASTQTTDIYAKLDQGARARAVTQIAGRINEMKKVVSIR